ncbi:MAG TPA: DMT family transporter [Candidatus Limnocylindrales bacterium]|nr:DMT family transporter [Candidatus Limnocylindrales bacterium]
MAQADRGGRRGDARARARRLSEPRPATPGAGPASNLSGDVSIAGLRANDASRRELRLAEAGVLAVVVFWAANFIVVKAANEQIPPLAFAFLRFGLAAGLLLAALRIREGAIRMPRADLLPILGLGAIGFGIYQVLWATALQSIPAGTSAFLIAATPVLTALLAVVAGSDVLTRGKLAGSLVSFGGVAIVVAGGAGLALDQSLAGDLLTLVAAVCWAVYTAFGAPVLRRHSPLRTTAWAMVGGSIVLLLPGLWQASTTSWSAVEPGAWAGLLYSSLIPAGIANVLVFNGIRLLGPTRITAWQFLVPFVAVVIAFVVLGEQIQPAEVAGGLVIIVGVAMSRSTGPGRVADAILARILPTE